MTVKNLTKDHLKRELLNVTINILKQWVDTKLVFTEKVEVLITNTGNDTVDDVSIKFAKPLELRPGCDTVFLALHYKDEDLSERLKGDHFRFHHAHYGLFSEDSADTWVKTLSMEQSDEGLFIAHHALLQLVNVLEEIRDFCDSGSNYYDHFDPASSCFPFDLVVGDDKFIPLF